MQYDLSPFISFVYLCTLSPRDFISSNREAVLCSSVTCVDKTWFSFLVVVLYLFWRDDSYDSCTVHPKLWTTMALHTTRNITGGKASKGTSGTFIFQEEGIFLLQYWNFFYEFSHLSNYIEVVSSNVRDSENTKMMVAYLSSGNSTSIDPICGRSFNTYFIYKNNQRLSQSWCIV